MSKSVVLVTAGAEVDVLVEEFVMGRRPGVDLGKWPEHAWKRRADGSIDDFAYDDGTSFGRRCVRCGYVELASTTANRASDYHFILSSRDVGTLLDRTVYVQSCNLPPRPFSASLSLCYEMEAGLEERGLTARYADALSASVRKRVAEQGAAGGPGADFRWALIHANAYDRCVAALEAVGWKR